MATQSTAQRRPSSTRKATGEARSLSASMPRLILEARRVASTVIHGLHGRRRAGTGENFWQFRRFVSGEPAARVDWRRSARDDHLYVREQEWEAAHTVWIWPDRSPSMVFASPLVWETKLDRALVIAFALAEVLVEGGERVGIPGLMRPSASRNIIEKMAEIIVHDAIGAREPAAVVCALAAVRGAGALGPVEPDRGRAQHDRAIVGERRAGPRGADRRSGRGDLPVLRPRRVLRSGGRALDHGRPRRGLARGLPEAARAPPRRDPRRDRPARLELHHPSHRPARDRTAAQAAYADGRRVRAAPAQFTGFGASA